MPKTVETRSTLALANQSSLSPLAGKPALKEMLVKVARLESAYFERRAHLQDPNQLVSFGTSGHRASPFQGTFTEAHILAIAPASCVGLKVLAKSDWFAARPSGTEDIYRIYAESFKSERHLNSIVAEAQNMATNALRSAAAGRQ